MKSSAKRIVAAVLFAICATTTVSHAADDLQERVKSAADTAIRPVMAKDRIPGMAVAITVAGKTYVFSHVAASTETPQPVTPDTFLEIDTVHKTLPRRIAGLCK